MRVLIGVIVVFLSSIAFADNGVVALKSHYSVKITMDRLQNVLKNKGMTIFKRVDHAQGAASVGKTLRPTELLIFGNPKVGTPLMQCAQTVALDLPQKMLVWEDSEGIVWLGYNSPNYLAERHRISGCDQVLNKVSTALGNFAKAATQKK
ncbi:MAG: DUF302 domain-containing protein [Pseudomonadota bacterium]